MCNIIVKGSNCATDHLIVSVCMCLCKFFYSLATIFYCLILLKHFIVQFDEFSLSLFRSCVHGSIFLNNLKIFQDYHRSGYNSSLQIKNPPTDFELLTCV